MSEFTESRAKETVRLLAEELESGALIRADLEPAISDLEDLINFHFSEKEKSVYRFEVDQGRGFEVSGLFVATRHQIEAALGRTASFGEICGKHSEMELDLEQSQLEVVSSDQTIVRFVETQLKGGTGYNPLSYIRCEECHETAECCFCEPDGSAA